MKFIFIFCVAILSFSCQKLIDVDPPITSNNGQNVYTTDATAISVLTGVYAQLSKDPFDGKNFVTGKNGIALQTGLISDELSLVSGGVSNRPYLAYYRNELVASSTLSAGSEYWSPIYNLIFTCNSAIEGLGVSTLTPSIRQQLLGEAKFLRAFFYFYLVNLFGDVPLVTGTDYKINSLLGRSDINTVYNLIISDLKEASDFLSSNYLDAALQPYNGLAERVRPSKWAAKALLARVYLYTKDYNNANLTSSSIIDQISLFGLLPLNEIFLKNSFEAIWQLQPVMDGHNTEEGWLFILPPTGPDNNTFNGHPVYLSHRLLNSFEVSDNRRVEFVDSVIVDTGTFYYPRKYKSATYGDPVTENLMVLRLGEQYLIRAEAKARLGDISGALADLNTIRNRSGLSNYESSDAINIVETVLKERRVELFTEWGHRWLDLKRSENLDEKMTPIALEKGGSWQSTDKLFPIPYSDIQRNQNLIQNQGY